MLNRKNKICSSAQCLTVTSSLFPGPYEVALKDMRATFDPISVNEICNLVRRQRWTEPSKSRNAVFGGIPVWCGVQATVNSI